MRIIVIGASGLIGKEVVKALSTKHEVVKVGHKSGDLRVDITSKESIGELFKRTGAFDALVSTSGGAAFGEFEKLTDENYTFSIKDKLMGQVNLVRAGVQYINDNGSFTLTSGILARDPMPGSAAISLVNAGLEGFTRAAALEMKRGIRVNVVSPPFATETLKALGMETSTGTPVAKFPGAYVESVESRRNGEVIDVLKFV
ncbi:MAG: short chain dehydrogenase [Ignavibacteriae bacterium 37-53-5]|nr:MAG: short chain dehydrogenase [Ignavibacteriae bacterium 37-53-5]